MRRIIIMVSFLFLATFITKKASAQLGYNEGYNDGFVACTVSLQNIIQENPLWSEYIIPAYYIRASSLSQFYTTDSYTFYNTNSQDRFMGFFTTESGTTAAQLAVNVMLASGTYAQIQGYQYSSSDYERGVYEGYNAAMVAIEVPF